MSGVLSVRCPNPACRATGQVPSHRQGKKVRCPACQTRFTVEAAVAAGHPPPVTPAGATPPVVGPSLAVRMVGLARRRPVLTGATVAAALAVLFCGTALAVAAVLVAWNPEPPAELAQAESPVPPTAPAAAPDAPADTGLGDAERKLEQLNAFREKVAAGQAALDRGEYAPAAEAFRAAADLPGVEDGQRERLHKLLGQVQTLVAEEKARVADRDRQLAAFRAELTASKSAAGADDLDAARAKLDAAQAVAKKLVGNTTLTAEQGLSLGQELAAVQQLLDERAAAREVARLLRDGREALDRERYEEALAAAEKALALTPADPAPARELLQTATRQATLAALAGPDYARAEKLARQMVALNPADPVARQLLLQAQKAANPDAVVVPAPPAQAVAAQPAAAPQAQPQPPVIVAGNNPPVTPVVVVANPGPSVLDLELAANRAVRAGNYQRANLILGDLAQRDPARALALARAAYQDAWKAAFRAGDYQAALQVVAAYQDANPADAATTAWMRQMTRERAQLDAGIKSRQFDFDAILPPGDPRRGQANNPLARANGVPANQGQVFVPPNLAARNQPNGINPNQGVRLNQPGAVLKINGPR